MIYQFYHQTYQPLHLIYAGQKMEREDNGKSYHLFCQGVFLLFFGFSQHIRLFEPRHEKSCLCHVRTTKVQISLRIRAV